MSSDSDDSNSDVAYADDSPCATIAMEYNNGSANIYIKSFSNVEPLPYYTKRKCRCLVLIGTNLSRTTWMRWPKIPTAQDMFSATVFRTLDVTRKRETIFNEFFCQEVSLEAFHRTLARVQFCDLSKTGREVVVAECDLWLTDYANHHFSECVVPLTLVRPDLGELELTIQYLPTAQRLYVDKVRATNLRVDPNATEVWTRCLLYTRGCFDEIHRTELKPRQKDETAEYVFNKRLYFDLLNVDILRAVLVVEAVERVNDEVVGHFGLSGNSPLCEEGLWLKAMANMREQVSAVIRLAPGT